MNQLIVIGCPRSGTKFMAKLCQEHGLDIPHERWGHHGISWFYTTADETIHAMNATTCVVHQVRTPLKVIGSITTANPVTWRFLFRKMNLDMPESKVLRSMMVYSQWNLMAEAKAQFTYRVEDIYKRFDDIMRKAGFGVRLNPRIKVPHNTNTRNHVNVTWDDLEKESPEWTERVKTVAKHYGYQV